MSSAFAMKIISWLIPVISPLLVAAIKAALADNWDKVPDWLKPLISAILGAVIGVATGDTSTALAIAGAAGTGAAMGALGKAGRDSLNQRPTT